MFPFKNGFFSKENYELSHLTNSMLKGLVDNVVEHGNKILKINQLKNGLETKLKTTTFEALYTFVGNFLKEHHQFITDLSYI